MINHITREDALNAIKTLLQWIGEDPSREGLIKTPERVLKSYEEHFYGYSQDPVEILDVVFSEIHQYDELIVLRDIKFESFCEHHWAPIIGHVHIGYLPRNSVVGISKLARLVNVFAKRFQIQERMTSQIASSLFNCLDAKGVAVVIEAEHHCITNRGVYSHEAKMVTQSFLGQFKNDIDARQNFLNYIKK